MCHSQINFKNDTSFRVYSHSLFTVIDSTFQLTKNPEFEIRFWTQFAKTMKRQLFVLSLSKGGIWSGRLFEKTYKDIDTLVEKQVDQSNLKSLWKELRRNNIQELPDENEIRDKSGEEINLRVFHGITVVCELISKQSKRSYRYYAPKSHSDEFKYIKEYKSVVRITSAIFKYCGIPLRYIS